VDFNTRCDIILHTMSLATETIDEQSSVCMSSIIPYFVVSEDMASQEVINEALQKVTPFAEEIFTNYPQLLPNNESEINEFKLKIDNIAKILQYDSEHIYPAIPQIFANLLSLDVIDTERLVIIAKGNPLYQTDLDRIFLSPYGAHTEILLRQMENLFDQYPNGKFQLEKNDQEYLLLKNLDLRNLSRRQGEKKKAWDARVKKSPEQSKRIEGVLYNCNKGLISYVIRQSGFYGEGVWSNGSLGLLYAIRQYDPQKGAFSTFATYKIKGALRDAINAGEENDLPHPDRNTRVRFNAVKKMAAELYPDKNFNSLSSEEIECAINGIEWKKRSRPEVETIRAIRDVDSSQIVELDEFSNPFEEESREENEYIPSNLTDWETVNEEIENNKKARRIFEKIDELITAHKFALVYKEIMYLRYIKDLPIKEIAIRYNVSHQTIEQKINRALELLSNSDIDS